VNRTLDGLRTVTQICHEWNTADHVADYEGGSGRSPFTRGELQAFFDHIDDAVAVAQRRGRKGAVAAWRDATLFEVTYAWGLRRREVTMLDTVDFTANRVLKSRS
jgi:integrase/recombinase XerC